MVDTLTAVYKAICRDDIGPLTNYLDNGGSVNASRRTVCPDDYGSFVDAARRVIFRNNICPVTDCLGEDGRIETCYADYFGWCLLHLAANCGSTNCLSVLLDRGADINATCIYGKTPLRHAISSGRVDCVQLLLECGANRDIADENGLKPIDFCGGLYNQETADKIWQLLNGGGQATKAAKPRK